MVDAGALFALGKRLAGEAIRSSGTRGRAFTETTVTGDDLTQSTVTTVLYEGPVIVTVKDSSGSAYKVSAITVVTLLQFHSNTFSIGQ